MSITSKIWLACSIVGNKMEGCLTASANKQVNARDRGSMSFDSNWNHVKREGSDEDNKMSHDFIQQLP